MNIAVIRQYGQYSGVSKGGPGVAMATPNGRLATPVAATFRFLDLILF